MGHCGRYCSSERLRRPPPLPPPTSLRSRLSGTSYLYHDYGNLPERNLFRLRFHRVPPQHSDYQMAPPWYARHASLHHTISLTESFPAWNTGTCLYMLWSAIGCLNAFINSIVWTGNAIDKAPLWCDFCKPCDYCNDFNILSSRTSVATRLLVAFSVAIPAASLCINRRLYNIASCSAAHITRSDVSTVPKFLPHMSN